MDEISEDLHAQHFRDMNRRIMLQRAANRSLQARLDEAAAAKDRAIAERDSFRAGNTALLEALMNMVAGHCASLDDGDAFIITMDRYEKDAFSVLIEAGMMERQVDGGDEFYKLNWVALDARKPKRQTWSEAVHEVVTDPQEIARLLALDDEKE